jgi:hypothetical protein
MYRPAGKLLFRDFLLSFGILPPFSLHGGGSEISPANKVKRANRANA